MGAELVDDDALVELARRGDLHAFNQLVERYQARVYNLALRLVGSPETAEEIAQETFLSAYHKLEQFSGHRFSAWLLRIAANNAKDELRRRSRRPSASFEQIFGNEQDYLEPPDPGADVEHQVEQAALGRILWEALRQISDEQRLAIVLIDVEGYDYQDAAEALQWSVGTVKSRVSRGRAKLREYLSDRSELLEGFRRLED